MSLNYVFMGSPLFAATILETLCEKLYPPVAVVTPLAKATGRGQKLVGSEVEYFAIQEGLTVFTTGDVNSKPTMDALRIFKPDLILVAAFGHILRDGILQMPSLFCLNVHGSLLPKYRGAAPVQHAIWNGDRTTGVTIQKMAKKLDAGDILLAKEMAIEPDETSENLLKRMAHVGGDALVEAIRLIEKNEQTFTPQNEAEATYARKIEKTDAPLNWQESAERLENQVRALQPWPITETKLAGVRLKVYKAHRVPCADAVPPGTILTDSVNYLSVKCAGAEALSLTEVQLENRKRLDVREFLKGYRGAFPHAKMDGGPV